MSFNKVKYCEKCGMLLGDTANFCSNCGNEISCNNHRAIGIATGSSSPAFTNLDGTAVLCACCAVKSATHFYRFNAIRIPYVSEPNFWGDRHFQYGVRNIGVPLCDECKGHGVVGFFTGGKPNKKNWKRLSETYAPLVDMRREGYVETDLYIPKREPLIVHGGVASTIPVERSDTDLKQEREHNLIVCVFYILLFAFLVVAFLMGYVL